MTAKARPGRLARRITRREVLRWASGSAALALGGGLPFVSSAEAAAPSQETLLRVGTSLDIKTLDPGRTLENQANNINKVTYDSLVTFEGEDLRRIRPWLATRWTVSRDGRTYTFTLRPNVKFASGNPLTSADVKWSFERLMNIKGPAAFLLDGVETVQAPDPLTVVLNLREPVAALLAIMTDAGLCPVDSKLVMGVGGDASANARDKDTAEVYLNTHSAGSGAYTLASYTPKQEITLVKNPSTWRGAPKFDRIIIRNIPEAGDQALMVQKGDLDIAVNIGPTEVARLKQAPGISLKTTPVLNVVSVAMNTNPAIGGAFSNPKVQDAVRYALDYDGILALADPGAVRAAGVIPTTLPGSRPIKEAVKMDRERARASLREANLGEVSGTLTYSGALTAYGVDINLLTQKIQQDLASIGIKLALNNLPYPVWIDMMRSGKIGINLLGWNADYMDASDYLIFLPGGAVGGRRVGWQPDQSPQAAELVRIGKLAVTETNTVKRIAYYQQVDRGLAQGPYVPLFQPAHTYAFRSNLRGVTWVTGWYVDYGAISRA